MKDIDYINNVVLEKVLCPTCKKDVEARKYKIGYLCRECENFIKMEDIIIKNNKHHKVE